LAWLLCFFGNDALVISADLAKFIEDKKSTLKLEWTMLTAAIVILSLLSSINISILLPMSSKAAEKANNEVLFSNIAQEVSRFENPWLLYSRYIDAVNENSAQNMLPKWENRLGGAQEFMSTHCFTMTEAGRVDPTVQALLQ
jgi:hypothetical protein